MTQGTSVVIDDFEFIMARRMAGMEATAIVEARPCSIFALRCTSKRDNQAQRAAAGALYPSSSTAVRRVILRESSEEISVVDQP